MSTGELMSDLSALFVRENMCMCVCLRTPEINVNCLYYFPLYFETVSLAVPEVYLLG